MIRAVAFDIGKVLLDFDYGILVRKMAPRSRLDVPALEQLLGQSPLLAKYESGQMKCEEFFLAVGQETGYDGTQEEFAALFENIFTPIKEVIVMHEQIVASGLPTYTFSNTNAIASRHISQTYDFWPRFSKHILSHEVGSLKPESKIYEALESVAGCAVGEIAYLDDRHENVVAGKLRGWQAVQFADPAQARAGFGGLGLPV